MSSVGEIASPFRHHPHHLPNQGGIMHNGTQQLHQIHNRGDSQGNSSSLPHSASTSLQNSPTESRSGSLVMPPQAVNQHQHQNHGLMQPQPVPSGTAPALGLRTGPQLVPSGQQIHASRMSNPPQASTQQVWSVPPATSQQQQPLPTSQPQHVSLAPPPPPPASAPPSLSQQQGLPASLPASSIATSSGSIPSTFNFGGAMPSASPLLSLSQLGEMTSAVENAAPVVAAAGRAHARKPSQSQTRPQLRAITTALPQQDPSAGSPHSAASARPQAHLQPGFVQTGRDDGSQKEAAAIQKIGVLLDDVVSLAFNARDLFRKGDHGPSSLCLTELSRSLARIGDLGSQSLAEMQGKDQQQQQPKPLQQSRPHPSSMHPPSAPSHTQAAFNNRNASSPEQLRNNAINIEPKVESEFADPVLESPGIRKRGMNPFDDLPMKTMRGQHGTPIDPPGAPPSAPPATNQDNASHDEKPSQPTPPALLHTNSAPLVPQLKTVGPSPLGPTQVQTHGWHDPGSGAVSGPLVGPSGLSPIVAQSEQSFAPGVFAPSAQPGVTQPSLPPSPQGKTSQGHTRTHSLLDEVFSRKTALNGSNASPIVGYPGDDDSAWMAESGAQSPDDAWSPSHDIDEAFAHASTSVDHATAAAAGGHGQSLKGSIDAPDMPGRGPILPLPENIQERLDGLFYQYLRFVCSHNDCSDSNGEGIHQTLMPKRMSRLNHSEDFRPFKFRIQAFVNRWQEEVYKNGLTEEQCSPKRLRQYLWTQPYISRFNEDGRKAKSKGNHVWIVEGRKLNDDEWEFQRFERKIVGPADKVANEGVLWQWPLRVWDPQMSAASIKPTFTVLRKPDWLELNDNEDSAERHLSGTPTAASKGGPVSVTAQCYHSNGSLQHLELSFELEMNSLDSVPVAQQQSSGHGTPHGSRHPSATLASHPLLQDVAGHPAVQPLGVIPAAGTPAASGFSISSQMMHHPELVARLPSTMLPSHLGQGGQILPQMSQPPQPEQTTTTTDETNQFFASMNYPFTPPDAFTSQPAFFMPDAQGDSPMPMAMPQQQEPPTFSSLHMAQQAPLQQPMPHQQQQQQQMAASGDPSQTASPFPQINNIPVLATPAQTGSLEPHDQVHRAQVRAMIDRMQRNQTASLSLQLPERRKSQSVRHQQSQVEPQHHQQLAQQQQQQHLLQQQQQAHGNPNGASAPAPSAADEALSPFTSAMPLGPQGGLGPNGAGLSQASLDPVLSPALEMNPFADLSSFNITSQQMSQAQQAAAAAGGGGGAGGPPGAAAVHNSNGHVGITNQSNSSNGPSSNDINITSHHNNNVNG